MSGAKNKSISSFIEEKHVTVKSTFDCDAELLKEADSIMKENGHTRRQVIEASLKKYIEENTNEAKRK
jgi:metal-responsive CopG/Arc/MetJ family transcriptional regulator